MTQGYFASLTWISAYTRATPKFGTVLTRTARFLLHNYSKDLSLAITLKDLFRALLNATLTLLALCLFRGWKLAQSINNIKSGFVENPQQVVPLREQVQCVFQIRTARILENQHLLRKSTALNTKVAKRCKQTSIIYRISSVNAHAVWLYFRFNLSLREVEGMLLQCGGELWFKSQVASIGFGVPSISRALCWIKSSN